MAAHQTKLNVIGNNIANVNTYGFKASRVVFSDVLYQNLSTATEATATTGGTNASQLGYGTKVGSIDMLNTISSGATTGRALDVYIAGEGYLTVQPEAGANRYTRVGNLKFDAEGNLTDGGGSKVMGIPIDADGNPVLDANGTLKIDGLEAINVPKEELEKYTGITIGKSGEITGIKAGDPEFTAVSGLNWLKSVTVPEDSNYTGNAELMVGYTVSVDPESLDEESVGVGAFTIPPTIGIIGTLSIAKSGSSYVIGDETELTDTNEDPFTAYGTPTVSSAGILTFSGMPGLKVDTNQFKGDGPFSATIIPSEDVTVLATIKTQGGVTEYLSVPEDWEFDAENPNIELTGGSGSINLNVDATEFANLLDLDTSGGLQNTTIGKIEAGSDKPVTLGYLAISKFANNDGLLQDGNGYFMESANSGEALASKAGTNGTGGTESSNLEMSNVDLSQEFTDMIIAQRGFQANSRIITVSDSILEELINLKR